MVTPEDHSLPVVDVNCSCISQSSFKSLHFDMRTIVRLYINAFNAVSLRNVDTWVFATPICI